MSTKVLGKRSVHCIQPLPKYNKSLQMKRKKTLDVCVCVRVLTETGRMGLKWRSESYTVVMCYTLRDKKDAPWVPAEPRRQTSTETSAELRGAQSDVSR